MRRKYLITVLFLLSLGVMSTLAISYTQVDLDESWGAEYTVNYVDAELQLSDPVTTINNATSVTVVLSASHSGVSTVKAKFVVEAQDSNEDPIVVDATGADVQVVVYYLGNKVEKLKVNKGSGLDLVTTHEMTAASEVDEIHITWFHQDGFTNEYQYGEVTVTDL